MYNHKKGVRFMAGRVKAEKTLNAGRGGPELVQDRESVRENKCSSEQSRSGLGKSRAE